jgi:hypothetical protein
MSAYVYRCICVYVYMCIGVSDLTKQTPDYPDSRQSRHPTPRDRQGDAIIFNLRFTS